MSADPTTVTAGELTRQHCGRHVTIPGLGQDPPATGLWLISVLHDYAEDEVRLSVRIRCGSPLTVPVAPETPIGVGAFS